MVGPARRRGRTPLARHGFAWNERTPSGILKETWAPAWGRWARSRDLGDPLPNMAMGMEIELVERMERGAKELAKAVAEEAGRPRRKPCVDALTRLKGVDVQTASLACAEAGDLPRLRGGRRASRRIGRTASEGSSGEGRRQGKVTKEGSPCLRHALAGGISSTSRQTAHRRCLRHALAGGISSTSRQTAHRRCLRPGHEVPSQVGDVALEADARLRRKCDAPKDAGRHANVAKVAVASELARWMRAIGLRAQRERAAAWGGPRTRPSPPRPKACGAQGSSRWSHAQPPAKRAGRAERAARRVPWLPAARGVCDPARTGESRTAGRGSPR